MRQRDYIRAMAGEGIRAARAAIINDMILAHNHVDDLCADFIEANPDHDPMPATRAYGKMVSACYNMCSELTRTSADKIWRHARLDALTKNPAKTLRWKCAALGLNPEQHNIDIALSGMVPLHDGERWNLAVAIPAPPPMSGPDHSHVVTDLVIINPVTGKAHILGDANPNLVPAEKGEVYGETFVVHADAVTWAREFATARLEWLLARENARRIANISPTWHGLPPTALAIGDVLNIRWPNGPNIETGVGIDAERLQRAIYSQANMPRVTQGRAA